MIRAEKSHKSYLIFSLPRIRCPMWRTIAPFHSGSPKTERDAGGGMEHGVGVRGRARSPQESWSRSFCLTQWRVNELIRLGAAVFGVAVL